MIDDGVMFLVNVENCRLLVTQYRRTYTDRYIMVHFYTIYQILDKETFHSLRDYYQNAAQQRNRLVIND